jgi:hypothetical protein
MSETEKTTTPGPAHCVRLVTLAFGAQQSPDPTLEKIVTGVVALLTREFVPVVRIGSCTMSKK